jgi:hypothetical protein
MISPIIRINGIPNYKLKLLSVKKFPVGFLFSASGNFSSEVENLFWYAVMRPFSFLPFFFWEKKNGALHLAERKSKAIFSTNFILAHKKTTRSGCCLRKIQK